MSFALTLNAQVMTENIHYLKKERIPKRDWYDWKWQWENRVTHAERLNDWMLITDEQKSLFSRKNFQMTYLTPYYLSHLNNIIASEPKIYQHITGDILINHGHQLNEKKQIFFDERTPFLQELSTSTILIRLPYPNDTYCFSHIHEQDRIRGNSILRTLIFNEIYTYISLKKSIQKIILSGLDFFLLSDGTILEFLSALKLLRSDILFVIHSESLFFIPMRFTKLFVNTLKKFLLPCEIFLGETYPIITSDVIYSVRLLIESGIIIVHRNMLETDNIPNNQYITEQLFSIGIKPHI